MATPNINAGTLFERYEKKFIVEPGKYKALLHHLTPHMAQDQYGLHTICTLYFDTDDYSIIRHSLNKPHFKEKLRLRSYGIPTEDDLVYLELKKKLSGVTYKRRVSMPLHEARAYLEHGIIPPRTAEHQQTFGEIDYFLRSRGPSPRVLLSYDRIALYGRADSDLRMTFDANIRWREQRLDLGEGDYGDPLTGPGLRLLEVKTLRALPLWLCEILSAFKIYPQSFSKYGQVYSDHLSAPRQEVILSA